MEESQLIENQEKPEQRGAPTSAQWLAEIKSAEKNQDHWQDQGRKTVKRFLDRRDANAEGLNKLNLFTANVLILISTLYARFPKPMVVREFDDQDDDVARVAATIIERNIKIRSRDDMDRALRLVVQDRLVPGLGQIWMRYEPKFEKRTTEAVVDPMSGMVLEEAMEYEEKIDEKVVVDYVFWEDFLWSPARTWEDVRWVARRVKMSRVDAEKRFGPVITKELKFTKGGLAVDGDRGEAPQDSVEYATIYEIWCKRSRKVYWVSPGFDFMCDTKPDPFGLKEMFPCPKPLLAMHSTSNLMPRPNYLMAQDQYVELDDINNRITTIERAIKVVGIADGNNPELERIFKEGIDNTVIPSRSFRDFAERGGFKGAIDWLPIDAMTNALDKLRQYRQDLIQQIYEIEGISDIMRGATKASETLGAQQLKAQYGSVKLQYLQMEVATFVEEALELKTEIIRNLFDAATIIRDSNIEQSNDREYAEQAVQLIKSPMFDIRVEVLADSMAVPEFTAERDGRLQYVRSISEMMTAAAPILEKEPMAGIAMLKVAQWAAASFRTGSTVESVLDKAIAAIEKSAMQPKPPAPPPAEIVAKTKKDETQAVLNLAKAEQAKADSIVALTEPIERSEPPESME